MTTQTKANLMMLMVTMLWGSSYIFMKMGLHSIEGFNLVALRFLIASFLAGAIFYKRFKHLDVKTMKHGFLLGLLLFSAMSVVTIGIEFTSISNAGFLFSLTVVFVPLLLAIFFRKKPEQKVIWGVGLAIVGIALLTLNTELKINSGDFLIILGALFYAIHIIVTDKVAKHSDAIILGVLQLGVAGTFGLVFSLLFEHPHFPNTTESWIAILALSILCSAVGFIGQTMAQKHTTPTHTGLIFSLEPVFAALFAFIFMGEVLSARGYLGALLVLLGVFTAKFDFKKYISRKEFSNPIDGTNV
ncbi:DMT family transporter [Oikeobacillus pervagus]|uniref:DMT family transporter n=1 Tax=Oikeobacillus pervagus TaxID=1325931 RepID=UPI0027D8B412|nr:DMT family transporter [Oikeobacillus pervagus]